MKRILCWLLHRPWHYRYVFVVDRDGNFWPCAWRDERGCDRCSRYRPKVPPKPTQWKKVKCWFDKRGKG